MRIRFSLAAVVTALVAALALPALTHAQQRKLARLSNGAAATTNRPAPLRAGRQRAKVATPASIEQELAEALSVVQDNHADGGKLDYNAVFKSSVSGMLHALDPHSNYFDPKEWEQFRTEQRSEYFGIGATVGDLREGEAVNTYVRATFQNSPAARAGLRFGDRIVEVNGQSMRGKPFYEVRDYLRGPRGSVARVTVERLATGRAETVEITRGAVPQPSIPEAYMIRPGVGYVAITGGFNLTTADEFREALANLHAQGMKMLVLDLRGNGGGLVNQAVRVANTFLQSGQIIVSQKGRIRGSSHSFVADNDRPDQTPLVVLVNRGSASASEIVAGALQDHDRALVVGETSFGKGLVQFPFQLEHGSALLLTIAKYYTPSGRLIQRDYSEAGFHEYLDGGRRSPDAQVARPVPNGPESRTTTGRAVYGGGGITPDETVRPRLISPAQQRLMHPIFAFALELARARVGGFEAYQVQRPISFGHDLRANDFPVTDSLYRAFREFVAGKPSFKLSPAQLDRQRAFIERQLRYDLATAAYGTTTALQVYNADDPQIARAIDLLPRARDLAQTAWRTRNPSE
ncbi:MAG: S41 family peptidase [Pyrinomonadaceae bacterium]